MRFAFQEPAERPAWYEAFRSGVAEAFAAEGHELTEVADPELKLAFHVVDTAQPRPFMRKHRATFSVGVVALPEEGRTLLPQAYPFLVRTISNSLVVLPEGDPSRPWVVTPELGCYPVEGRGDGVYAALYQALAPMATSHLILDNRFVPDLPEELWQGTEATRELSWASREVDQLGLLPSPFPIRELLSDEEWRHLQHLYGIGGLSYGNFSIRHDDKSFWMSASGVNKGNLKEIGRDILLVAGYDPEAEAMILRVPPNVQPRRVSVDAIEHWIVYSRFPEVKAMVHLHAWVPGVPVTTFNYPCGTREVGEEMVEILSRTPDPGRTVIGMRNHGITATGPNFHDILERLAGRIHAQVPMAAADLSR